MIRWCCYCQKFLGEAPPFDEYYFSHGICPACCEEKSALDALVNRHQGLIDLYREMQASARGSQFTLENPASFLDRGLKLGATPVDLLMGFLGPAMCDVGRRWSLQELSVADEHRFTSYADDVLRHFFARQPERLIFRNSAKPEVLLVLAEGNYHSLGIRIVEFGLMMRGIPSYVSEPSLPSDEILALARRLAPKYLGISVALMPQLKTVREVLVGIEQMAAENRPRVVIGGQAVRMLPDLDLGPTVRVCFDGHRFVEGFESRVGTT